MVSEAGHREGDVLLQVRLLALADRVEECVYSSEARHRFADVDLVIACGDLPYSYLEYVVSVLDVPVCFVRGNHDPLQEDGPAGPQSAPAGALDLHGRSRRVGGLLIAGVEGSVRYKPGPFQYSQREMWWQVLRLLPRLAWNRLRHGRWLDVFVSHAPPRGVHDRDDPPHHGIDAFHWLVRRFKPSCHLHGHVHLFGPHSPVESHVGPTRVVNAFGRRIVELELPRRGMTSPPTTHSPPRPT
jgi:uncharacterized protein